VDLRWLPILVSGQDRSADSEKGSTVNRGDGVNTSEAVGLVYRQLASHFHENERGRLAGMRFEEN
jgi:hypothetical protein